MQTILRQISRSRTRFLALLALLCILLFGIFELQSVFKTNNFKYDDLLDHGIMSSTFLPIEDVRALKGLPEDSLKPEYARLKNIVNATKRINESTKFVYLFAIRNNNFQITIGEHPCE